MDEPIIVSSSSKSDNKRVKKMAGAGVAVLAALVLVPKLLGGGGGTPSVTEFPVSNATPKVTIAPAGAEAIPETFEGFTSKNPFKPLVDLNPDAASSGGDTAAVGPTSPAVVVPPEITGPPATIPTDPGVIDNGGGGLTPPPGFNDGSTTTTVPPPAPQQGSRVGLLSIYGDPTGRTVASVRVNDATYQVAPGDGFASSFKVISLDPYSRCGDFLFGDDRFRLCEGDEVTK